MDLNTLPQPTTPPVNETPQPSINPVEARQGDVFAQTVDTGKLARQTKAFDRQSDAQEAFKIQVAQQVQGRYAQVKQVEDQANAIKAQNEQLRTQIAGVRSELTQTNSQLSSVNSQISSAQAALQQAQVQVPVTHPAPTGFSPSITYENFFAQQKANNPNLPTADIQAGYNNLYNAEKLAYDKANSNDVKSFTDTRLGQDNAVAALTARYNTYLNNPNYGPNSPLVKNLKAELDALIASRSSRFANIFNS